MSPVTPTDGILNLLLRLWQHLSRHRQRQFWLLLGLMLTSAFAEIISLGAVLPFLSIFIAPDRVFNHPLGSNVAQALGITSADQMVLPITIAFGMAALVAGAIRILLLWTNTRFSYDCGTDFSVKMYQSTLYQPYSVHATLNSSEMISIITQKVSQTVGVLTHLLQLISSSILMVAILGTLIAIEPMVALIATIVFGLSYGIVSWLVRNKLKYNSQLVAREQTNVIKALQEGLGGIRDVILDGTQAAYCDIYRRAEYPLKRAWASNLFVGGCPRFAMEALGITLITTLAYGLSIQPGGFVSAISTLGALALSTQRILPALQQGYYAWTVIVGNAVSLTDTIELLDQSLPAEALEANPLPLSFQGEIRFENVRFRYSSDGPWVLDDLNFTIPKGVRLGIVGSTGSGKSTTLDLLMGLLLPAEGELLVDGQSISGNRIRAWQQTIAHVPQSIYLSDSTIAENIAFGVPQEAIDLERVKEAAHKAQIADFIESKPEGYNTFVGERGIRLSGGQRQRLGIARAFYKQATVLVLDEATSALDNETERFVMRAIKKEINSNFTIVLIAHRLTTVKDCDMIIELEQGRVVAQGTYEQLLESSPTFRRKAFVTEKI